MSESVFVADEPVSVGWWFGHTVSMVRADVLSSVRDSGKDAWFRVVPGAGVVPWTLAYGACVDFVYLLVSPSRTE